MTDPYMPQKAETCDNNQEPNAVVERKKEKLVKKPFQTRQIRACDNVKVKGNSLSVFL